MSFQYPQFLWALSLVIIPILIHLFNLQRYKTLYFSDLTLLKSIQIESKKRSRVKNFLLLLCRILLVSLLVIAFCKPISNPLNSSPGLTSQRIGIYLDNSYSMSSTNDSQSLLEIAKSDAIHLINSCSNETRFYVLTNDKSTNKGYSLDKEQAKSHIQNTTFTSANMELNQLVLNQNEQFKSNPVYSYWFTDLQKNQFNHDAKLQITDSSQFLVSLYQRDDMYNISIDSIWFKEKDRKILVEDEVFIKITNWNDKRSEIQLKLIINESEIITQKLVSLEKFQEKTVSIKYILKTHGVKMGELYINDVSYNDLKYDDKLIFTYSTNDQYKVNYLYLDSNFNEYAFKSLFNTLNEVSFESVNISDGFNENDIDGNLIILDEIESIPTSIYQQFKDQHIVLIPPPYYKSLESTNLFLQSYGLSLNRKPIASYTLSEKNLLSPFFKNVFKDLDQNIDLPKFKTTYEIKSANNVRSLMGYENDDDFLVETIQNNKTLYLFNSSFRPENSNITSHAIFVPTFLKIKENTSINQDLYYLTNHVKPIKIRQDLRSTKIIISDQNNKFSIHPTTKLVNGSPTLYLNGVLEKEGLYYIKKEDSVIKTISLNSNRRESELQSFQFNDFTSLLEKYDQNSFFKLVRSNKMDDNREYFTVQSQKDYWIYFIVLALIFIILEIIIIKYYEKPV